MKKIIITFGLLIGSMHLFGSNCQTITLKPGEQLEHFRFDGYERPGSMKLEPYTKQTGGYVYDFQKLQNNLANNFKSTMSFNGYAFVFNNSDASIPVGEYRGYKFHYIWSGNMGSSGKGYITFQGCLTIIAPKPITSTTNSIAMNDISIQSFELISSSNQTYPLTIPTQLPITFTLDHSFQNGQDRWNLMTPTGLATTTLHTFLPTFTNKDLPFSIMVNNQKTNVVLNNTSTSFTINK